MGALLQSKIVSQRKDESHSGKEIRKKFVRYKEGAEMYSISQSLFERLAKVSGACYKIGRAVIVDCQEFERYLESYKMPPEC